MGGVEGRPDGLGHAGERGTDRTDDGWVLLQDRRRGWSLGRVADVIGLHQGHLETEGVVLVGLIHGKDDRVVLVDAQLRVVAGERPDEADLDIASAAGGRAGTAAAQTPSA